MKHEFASNTVTPARVAATIAALIASIGLSACGGGSGGGGNEATAIREEGAAPADGSRIKVDGQSRSVEAVDGKVGVLLPVASSSYGVFAGNMDGFRMTSIDVAELAEAAPGAYMKFGQDALLSGTITDLSGNGQYAIGRWTDGADLRGGTYNANQGRVWAVGQRVAPSVSSDSSLTCSLHAATRPVAIDGNTPPGKVTAGTGQIFFTGDEQRPVAYDLSLAYEIGKDTLQTFNASSVRRGLHSSSSDRRTLASDFFGVDPAKPYLTVAYTIQSPTAGAIHGVAVMACASLNRGLIGD